jgi:hypothetical protein
MVLGSISYQLLAISKLDIELVYMLNSFFGIAESKYEFTIDGCVET